MIKFLWFWMILLLPLPLVFMYILKVKQNKITSNATFIFPKLQYIKNIYSKNDISYRGAKFQKILLGLAWALLVISLMRPELINDVAYSKNVGYDLMLAVDLSRSMDIVDFSEHGKPVSRIAATKKVVSNFVRNRGGDRVGLIVFADQAFLTIPLTLDTLAVTKLLNNLLVGMAGELTAIGDAIAIGVQNLRNRPLASRILILLTDGEDTASRILPIEAAQIAKDSNIKIYTIGIGNKLDETLLEKVADLTGGIYYKVTDVNSLQRVYQQIDQLEKTEAAQKVLLIRTPLYHWFLGSGLLLLMVLYVFSNLSKVKKYGSYAF